jgi:threonine/homoserine/homoserine lactone efflux protein
VLAFLVVAAMLIVIPGQDTALVIRNAVAGRRRGGVSTAAGVATAQLAWTAATALGLAALLVAWRPAFDALRVAGAVYLVLLGARLLRAAARGRGRGHGAAAAAGGGLGARRAYRQGLVSNLGNPKMGVFFTSLLPQFASSAGGLLALGAVFGAMTLLWLAAYTCVVARLGATLARPRVRRALDSFTGAVLVAFGVRLATESA